MAGTDLRHSTLQLVSKSAHRLPRRLWRWLFPIDVSDAAVGNRSLPEQHRMVLAFRVSLWPRHFPAWPAHCSVSDVWGDAVRRAFLYGARAYRTAIRHRPRAAPCHGSRPGSAARPRVVALFHLAPFQKDASKRHSNSRKFSRGAATREEYPTPGLLERGRERSASPSYFHL